jgi:hypothetical protein
MKENNIDDDDLRKIIEMAHNLSSEEQKKMSLKDVKSIGENLGVDAKKIERAFQMLQAEKQKEKAAENYRKNMIYGVLLFAVIVIAFTYIIVVSSQVRKFQGNVKFRFTNSVVSPKTTQELSAYTILENTKTYLYVQISKYEKQKLSYKIYEPNDKLYEENDIKTVGKSKDITLNIPINLPFNAKIGKWKVELYVESKEKPYVYDFNVELGDMVITLTDELNEKAYNKAPMRKLSEFSRKQHKFVLCHIFWNVFNKERGGDFVIFKWIKPDGTEEKKHKLVLKPTNPLSYYWAKAGLVIKDIENGDWRLELFYGNTKIAEKNFKVID